jgi:heme exporter protein C
VRYFKPSLGLAFAPEDYQQGNSFRIIYVHVPASILAQSCYMLMAIAGAIGLIWKMKMAHVIHIGVKIDI